jgi:hypothetical protein
VRLVQLLGATPFTVTFTVPEGAIGVRAIFLMETVKVTGLPTEYGAAEAANPSVAVSGFTV